MELVTPANDSGHNCKNLKSLYSDVHVKSMPSGPEPNPMSFIDARTCLADNDEYAAVFRGVVVEIYNI